jgi:hypothetical protein
MAGCIVVFFFWAVIGILNLIFPSPPEEPKFKEVTDEDIVI